MCGQMNRCRRASCGTTRQSVESGSSCCCPCTCGCGCNCGCNCGCGCGETEAPTATISMADYEPFILVPTTVFDQGDVDCGCQSQRGCNW